MPELEKLEKQLGVVFKNKDLLKTALTHRSYINENPPPSAKIGGGGRGEHNERLEFLGDAVLELAITEYLFTKFPEKPEGDLTNIRAALVNAVILGNIAHEELEVNDFLLLSRGEMQDTGRARLAILANTFEALVGAMHEDGGYAVAKEFILRVLTPKIPEILEKKLYKDAKSLFQEEAQDRVGITPTYEVLKETGPDHDRHFEIGVYLEKELVAQGEGASKQEAQQSAARAALEKKKWG